LEWLPPGSTTVPLAILWLLGAYGKELTRRQFYASKRNLLGRSS